MTVSLGVATNRYFVHLFGADVVYSHVVRSICTLLSGATGRQDGGRCSLNAHGHFSRARYASSSIPRATNRECRSSDALQACDDSRPGRQCGIHSVDRLTFAHSSLAHDARRADYPSGSRLLEARTMGLQSAASPAHDQGPARVTPKGAQSAPLRSRLHLMPACHCSGDWSHAATGGDG